MPYDDELGTFHVNTVPSTPHERLLYLRNYLNRLNPKWFDMNYWYTRRECGTVACIGGWTELLFGYEGVEPTTSNTGALVGLTSAQSWALFYPPNNLILKDGRRVNGYDATTHQAVKVIDHLIATGKVDWRRAYD